MILLDAGQRVPGPRIMAGAKQRNPGVRRTGRGEAGTLLLRAETESEYDRDNRAGASLTIGDPLALSPLELLL
jgi:hypothetical protein